MFELGFYDKKDKWISKNFKTFKDAYEYAVNKLKLHEFEIEGTRYYRIYS